MLSKTEKDGCKQMLNKLSSHELLSLAETVTKRQISLTSKSEAVQAILTYTEEPVELLRRRKMKREFLFQYLSDCNIVVKVSADKKELIRAVLKHWGNAGVDLSEMDVDVSEENVASSTSGVQTESTGTKSQSCSANLTQNNGHIPAMPMPGSNQTDSSTHAAPITDLSHSSTSQMPSIMTKKQTDPNTQALGEHFAKWFYEMLNSFNPTVPGAAKDFGPQHFWDDAKIRINSMTPSPSTEEYEGPQLVSERLISFTKEEQLLFNPNIGQEGVFVKSSMHGLVMVMVCGTIHRSNNCLGVFQQVFGIIKDPRYNDNWKIKVTYLDVKSSQVTTMPKLEGNIESLVNSLIPV